MRKLIKIKSKVEKQSENTFIPLPPNIMRCKRFWENQSLRGDLMDKGGSFNVDLYLDYLAHQIS